MADLTLPDIKKYIEGISIDKKQEISKVVEQITDKDKANQFGVLSKKERSFLFELIVVNELFFKNSERINKIIENFLLLSKSDEATALKIIADLYKTEINQNSSFNISATGKPIK